MKPLIRLRLLGPAVLLTAAGAMAGHPTAVYTLDAYHQTIYYDDEHPIAPQLRKLAESAQIVPGGAIFKLSIPEPPPSRQRDRPGGAQANEQKPLPVTLALFRDLDETVYLAACPVAAQNSEQPAERRRARRDGTARPATKPGEPLNSDIDDCRDIEAGDTFSIEFDQNAMKVVVRGRQVPFTVYRTQPKLRGISTPYELTSSKLPPPSGPAPSTPPAEGMPPQSKPRWEPPEVAQLSGSHPPEPVRSDLPLAQTSLRTGRVGITCDSTRAQVYVDGAYVGACPIEAPLVAGRHSVLVRQPGSEDWTREFRVEAGATIRIRAGER